MEKSDFNELCYTVIMNEKPAGKLTVAGETTALLTIKKSEFIAVLTPVLSQDDVNRKLAAIRKEHFKANHHVYCYVLDGGQTTRSSDDGEPSGTAGKPILGVVTAKGLTDVLLIVTRYFGGVKLGAGGLTRTYAQAASQVCDTAEMLLIQSLEEIDVRLEYALSDRVLTWAEGVGIVVTGSIYGEDVCLSLLLPKGKEDLCREELSGICRGADVFTAAREKIVKTPYVLTGEMQL